MDDLIRDLGHLASILVKWIRQTTDAREKHERFSKYIIDER